MGTAQNITWTKTGTMATVKLEYSTNGFADELATVVIVASTNADPLPADNAGTYAWTIPDAISSTVKARVANNADTTVKDTSDGNFKITGAFTLTSPNGTEKLTVGSSSNVTWTRTGTIANAKLEYSTNGGHDLSQSDYWFNARRFKLFLDHSGFYLNNLQGKVLRCLDPGL